MRVRVGRYANDYLWIRSLDGTPVARLRLRIHPASTVAACLERLGVGEVTTTDLPTRTARQLHREDHRLIPWWEAHMTELVAPATFAVIIVAVAVKSR